MWGTLGYGKRVLIPALIGYGMSDGDSESERHDGEARGRVGGIAGCVKRDRDPCAACWVGMAGRQRCTPDCACVPRQRQRDPDRSNVCEFAAIDHHVDHMAITYGYLCVFYSMATESTAECWQLSLCVDPWGRD